MTMPTDIRTPGRGFTLIEILVVVVIIGLAGAVIIPQIGSRDDLKAASSARAIMADLIYAQNLAITQQANCYVQFDVAGQKYSALNSLLAVVTHPVYKTPYTVTFSSRAGSETRECELISAAFVGQAGTPCATIGFDELGTPLIHTGSAPQTMTSGSIIIRNGSHQLQIDIEPYTGQITVTSL